MRRTRNVTWLASLTTRGGSHYRNDGLGLDAYSVYKENSRRVSQVSVQALQLRAISNGVIRYTGVTIDTNFTNINKLPSTCMCNFETHDIPHHYYRVCNLWKDI